MEWENLYEKYGVERKKSYRWVVLLIVVIGVSLVVYFTYSTIFRPVKCSSEIKENIDILKQNITYLNDQFSGKSYYQDVKDNVTLIITYLNQAEVAWNGNKCSEAEDKLKAAATNTVQVSDYLYSKTIEEFLTKTSKVIYLHETMCTDGYILTFIENQGTDTIMVPNDLQFYLDDVKTIPSECPESISPRVTVTCKVGSRLTGTHKLRIVSPSNNATATAFCL